MKYYIGREKIVGTDIPFDRDKIVLRYLDDRTCGLIRIDNNHEDILCTFPLVSSEEVDKMRETVRERLSASGKQIDEKNLAGHTYLGGKEMAERMRLYKVSDYLPELPDESPKQYADRVSSLSDARLVSQDTRQFFQKVDIGLHQLPWEEQLEASSILIDPRFNKNEVASFCKQFGIAGLRTFISSTFGENINKQILALGEHSPDIAKMVFDKYGEILTAARDVESFLLPILQKKPIDAAKQSELLRSVKSHLTHRAKLIIEQIAETLLAKKSASIETIDSLKKNLSRVQSDIELFASTIKATTEADADVSLEDFAGASTAIRNGQDIPKKDREQMLTIYAQNFKGNPKKQARLLGEFSAALDSGKTKLYTLHYQGDFLPHHQGKLLSFIRFDEKDDHTLYAGSFNVDPNVRGMKIGEAMMEVALDTEAKEHILTGTCAGWKAICAKYIEGGFVGVDTKTTEGNEINIELIRDDKRRHLLKGPALTPEEIVSLSLNNKDTTLRVETISDTKQYTFPPLKEGYFLTRYLQPSRGGAWYLVFEKRPSSSEAR